MMKLKSNIPIIFSFLLLVLAVWWETSDIKMAFIFSCFLLGGYAFNFNVIYTYRQLKKSGFNLQRATEGINWLYVLISTPLIVVCFYFFMPHVLQLVGLIMTLCLLVGLFLLDLILNGLK